MTKSRVGGRPMQPMWSHGSHAIGVRCAGCRSKAIALALGESSVHCQNEGVFGAAKEGPALLVKLSPPRGHRSKALL